MSISKGAFGQSAKGGFIESPMGARGWPSTSALIVGGFTTGGSTENLFRLNPNDGSVIWSQNTTGTIRNIKQSPSGRTFVVIDDLVGDRIIEIDNATGATITTGIGVRISSLDVDQNTKVYAQRASDLDVVRLLASDLSTVEINCNSGATSGITVDGDGNIYCSNTSSGSTLLERFDSTGSATGTCPTNGASYSVFSPSGNYVYCVDCTANLVIHKIDKSTLSVVDTITVSTPGATSTQPQCWATDGTNIYFCASLSGFGLASFLIKIRISDFTEVDRFNSSTNAVPRSLNSVTKSGSSYIAVGQSSQNWDGNDGTFKNVWSLSSSLSLNWAVNIGTNFIGMACSASFVPR